MRILIINFFFFVITFQALGQSLEATNLKVDHLLRADLRVAGGYVMAGNHGAAGQQTGIANERPALGWEIASDRPATAQSAYRVLVSAHRDSLASGLGEVWDSGKVESDESVNVLYNGAPLATNRRYYWRVMVWDHAGHASPWSGIAQFVTAGELAAYKTSVYPLVKNDQVAVSMEKRGDVARVDFGKASFGQLKVTFDSPQGNDTVTVRFGEAILPDGRINPAPGGTIRYASYDVVLRQGRHTYTVEFVPDRRNTGGQAIKMPDYIGEVLPFRYVEIEGYTGNLDKSDIIRANVNYPFDDHAAHFESSDPVLNAVWELCKYSIKATTFAGVYVDGDRERIPYEGDVYINQLSHYGVDKDYSLARHSHEYVMHHATWPTEWILQSVLIAYNDYLYTGDIRSASHYYEDLKAKLLLPLRETNGLISTRTGKQSESLMQAIHFNGSALRDIVDWPHTGGFGMVGNGETDGFVFTDYNAVVNAYHYKALRDMERIAGELGRSEDAKQFAACAEETYRAFQSLLWDAQQGAYLDGVDTDHASLHTNMMTMAFGLVPEANHTPVIDFIRSRGMACSVFGSQFLLDAIYNAGDADYGLALLTSQSDRSWYNMIRAGSTITMEAWDNKFKPNQDWNHAWGAVPANIIPRKLMGVEPLVPGWKTFRVRPQIGSLTSASIKVPTIRGDVLLACVQDDSSYSMTLSVPANTSAHVELPVKEGSLPSVTLNGEELRAKTDDGWIKLPVLGSGTYDVKLAY